MSSSHFADNNNEKKIFRGYFNGIFLKKAVYMDVRLERQVGDNECIREQYA